MTESSLESIRRQIREAEERLRRSDAQQVKPKPDISELRDRESASPHFPPSLTPQHEDETAGSGSETGVSLQRRVRALAESSRDAFILVDNKGGWELANRHLPEWLGYTREEFRHVSLSEVFQPEDVGRLLSGLPQWLTGQSPLYGIPFDLRGKGGEKVPVLLSTHAWSNDDAEPVAYVVLEDMRGRRRLETQVMETKGFVDAMMRGGNLPILLLSREAVILEASRAACNWFGAEPEQLANLRLRNLVAGASHGEFDALLARVLAHQPEPTACCQFLHSAGTQFSANLSLTALTDAKGSVYRILGMMDHVEPDRLRADPGSEWGASPMSPGIASELAAYITANLKEISGQLSADDDLRASKPSLNRFLQSIERVRSVLEAWAASEEFGTQPSHSRSIQ